MIKDLIRYVNKQGMIRHLNPMQYMSTHMIYIITQQSMKPTGPRDIWIWWYLIKNTVSFKTNIKMMIKTTLTMINIKNFNNKHVIINYSLSKLRTKQKHVGINSSLRVVCHVLKLFSTKITNIMNKYGFIENLVGYMINNGQIWN